MIKLKISRCFFLSQHIEKHLITGFSFEKVNNGLKHLNVDFELRSQ